MAKIYTSTHKLIKILSTTEVEKDYTSRNNFDGFTNELHIVEFTVLVSKIGANVFKNSKNLIGVILADTVNSINKSAFEGCVKLEFINLNCVKTLGENAFKDCTSLKSVDLGLTTMIPENCFENCESLEDIINFKHIESIEKNTFKNCSSLSNLVLSDNLKYISEESFSGCGDVILTINETSYDNLELVSKSFKDVQFNKVISTDLRENDYITEFKIRLNKYNSIQLPELNSINIESLSDENLKELCDELKKLQKTKNKLNTLITAFNHSSE